MAMGAIFWVLWIVGLLFTGYAGIRTGRDYYVIGNGLLLWILLGLLGWAEFGAPIK